MIVRDRLSAARGLPCRVVERRLRRHAGSAMFRKAVRAGSQHQTESTAVGRERTCKRRCTNSVTAVIACSGVTARGEHAPCVRSAADAHRTSCDERSWPSPSQGGAREDERPDHPPGVPGRTGARTWKQ